MNQWVISVETPQLELWGRPYDYWHITCGRLYSQNVIDMLNNELVNRDKQNTNTNSNDHARKTIAT